MSLLAPAAAPTALTPLSFADLQREAAAPMPWLWHGYLAPGNLTLLTSQWKSGKTTLVSVLLSRLGQGGELAGLAVRPGRAAIVSEEAPRLWAERARKLTFGDHLSWYCRPFAGRPQPADWLALLDQLAAQHARQGLDLLVIDPLASFLPTASENDARSMLEALLPLQRLTQLGVAVLVLHHPRKGEPPAREAARGSGALPSCADIVLEMRRLTLASADRRRLLLGFSRHEATPARRAIELTDAGSDYLCCADEVEADSYWPVLEQIFTRATGKLTRDQVLQDWPDGPESPSKGTLWRWLECEVQGGRLERDGTGFRGQPFRYWLPEMYEKWFATRMNDSNWLAYAQRDDDELKRKLRAEVR